MQFYILDTKSAVLHFGALKDTVLHFGALKGAVLHFGH